MAREKSIILRNVKPEATPTKKETTVSTEKLKAAKAELKEANAAMRAAKKVLTTSNKEFLSFPLDKEVAVEHKTNMSGYVKAAKAVVKAEEKVEKFTPDTE